MIVAENLTRAYGDVLAVDGVSFAIGAGEVVGLLGHNGAGKTTIMKMLTGYLEPTSGRVLVDGEELDADREAAQAKIGYLPENCPVYPEMTVVDFLDYAAEMRRVPREDRDAAVKKAIVATNLVDRATQPISDLSRGLRQRVGVAQAIIHDPKIVILDEPTNGLDPSQIQQMRQLIRGLAEKATVIISTHILQEVQAVADRVIVVNRGALALDAPMKDLEKVAAVKVSTSLSPDTATEAFKGALGDVADLEIRTLDATDARATLHLSAGSLASEALAPKVARAILENGGELSALEPARRDLEAVFKEISHGQAEAAREVA